MRATMLVALLVALTACTDSAVPATTAPTTTVPPTTAPPTTPAPTATAPTTTAPTTTATTSPPVTARPAPEPAPGAPHSALDAFRARIEVTLAGEDGVPGIRAVGEGTYVAGDLACDLVADFGGFAIEEAAVVIGTDAWARAADDTDFVAVPRDDADLQASLDGCPASAGFWLDFDPGPVGGLAGTADTHNGIAARRVDASEGLADGLALGLLGDIPEGVAIARYTIWIADDGGYLAGADIAFTMPADVAEAEFGLALTGDVTFAFTLDVFDPDDPTLAVTPP